jgi:NAD(P)H-hydrate epimerase
MNVLSAQEMLSHEDAAFRSGLTAASLMEAAGEAMAARITALYPRAANFLVLVGKGNNGGDGLVVARHLSAGGKPVQVVLASAEDQLGELPRARLELVRRASPSAAISPWRDDLTFPASDGVVIDALLGLQAKGPLRGLLAQIVAQLNQAREARFFQTVALDLPSGLAAYEQAKAGETPPTGAVVVADVTIAVGFAKEVLCREAFSAWVGRLAVVPWDRAESTSTPRRILVGAELAGLLPRRGALSHKGDFGRLVIVAGSPGYSGAAVLCAQAAQAMGAGLLSVVTRPETVSIVAAQAPPEVMVAGWPDDRPAPKVLPSASVIVIGPGLGVDSKTGEMLRAAMAVGCPVLIDADGLNALAQHLDLLHEAKGPVVLTPHPGEMSRLVGRKFGVDEREAVAREFVECHHVTLVLKGTRTLVTAPGQAVWINTTGNPGLSTGGSGDTLSGLLGALLAQGLGPLEAARLGVWLHGHAADLVLAERGCEEGLTPTMLSAKLGAALVSLRAQAVAPIGLLERARQLEGQPPA